MSAGSSRAVQRALEKAEERRAELQRFTVTQSIKLPTQRTIAAQKGARTRLNSRFVDSTVINTMQANRYADTKELWRAREREIELETRQADSRGASNSTGGDAVGEADTRVVDSRPTQHSASEAEEWRPSTFFASKRKRGRGESGSHMDEAAGQDGRSSSDSGRERLSSEKPGGKRRKHSHKEGKDAGRRRRHHKKSKSKKSHKER